jgi:hypothetical protein
MIPEYQRQLEQLERNATALIERETARIHKEFVAIDKAAAIRAANHSKPTTVRAQASIHDLCVNNPALRKIIRDMQRATL